jgi:hypothetical protein
LSLFGPFTIDGRLAATLGLGSLLAAAAAVRHLIALQRENERLRDAVLVLQSAQLMLNGEQLSAAGLEAVDTAADEEMQELFLRLREAKECADGCFFQRRSTTTQ